MNEKPLLWALILKSWFLGKERKKGREVGVEEWREWRERGRKREKMKEKKKEILIFSQ